LQNILFTVYSPNIELQVLCFDGAKFYLKNRESEFVRWWFEKHGIKNFFLDFETIDSNVRRYDVLDRIIYE